MATTKCLENVVSLLLPADSIGVRFRGTSAIVAIAAEERTNDVLFVTEAIVDEPAKGENVKVTPEPVAVAAADNSNVVLFVIEAIVVEDGIPVPTTLIPVASVEVSAVVTVASRLVVEQESVFSAVIACCATRPTVLDVVTAVAPDVVEQLNEGESIVKEPEVPIFTDLTTAPAGIPGPETPIPRTTPIVSVSPVAALEFITVVKFPDTELE